MFIVLIETNGWCCTISIKKISSYPSHHIGQLTFLNKKKKSFKLILKKLFHCLKKAVRMWFCFPPLGDACHWQLTRWKPKLQIAGKFFLECFTVKYLLNTNFRLTNSLQRMPSEGNIESFDGDDERKTKKVCLPSRAMRRQCQHLMQT